jgi:hypothetical protein
LIIRKRFAVLGAQPDSNMGSDQLYYSSGEEIHLGDRVQYRGTFATVVVISTGDAYELAPGYEDQAGCDRGVTVCDDDGVASNLSDGDDQLQFVDRG